MDSVQGTPETHIGLTAAVCGSQVGSEVTHSHRTALQRFSERFSAALAGTARDSWHPTAWHTQLWLHEKEEKTTLCFGSLHRSYRMQLKILLGLAFQHWIEC